MTLGKVTGHVWATKKDEALNGFKLMIVESLYESTKREPIVAVDTIGAGIGEVVLVSRGSTARLLLGKSVAAPIDAAIVGIVDEIQN